MNSVLWKGTSQAQAQGWVSGNHVTSQCQPTSLFGFSESWSSRWSRGLRIKIRARAPAPLSRVWSPLPACLPTRPIWQKQLEKLTMGFDNLRGSFCFSSA